MERREFLKKTLAYSAAGLGGAGGLVTSCISGPLRLVRDRAIAEGKHMPKPTVGQLVWQDAEVGVIFHFDLAICAGEFAPNNMVRKVMAPSLYNPKKLDTDQWLEAAKAAGAKYAIFTATHFNGFMQWQSDLYPYGVRQAKWRNGKGDVVGDFVNSCRKHGVKPGLYFSTHRNVYWGVWGHYVDWGKARDTEEQAAFNRIGRMQTEELCSRYGPIIQIWYDAGVKTQAEGGPNVLPIFEKYQPNSVFYHSRQRADHRWIGNEQGYAGYPCWATMPNVESQAEGHQVGSWAREYLLTGDPNGSYWSPGMVDVPLRGAAGVHDWCWRPNQEHGVEPLDRLVKMYCESVGRNCNFVLGAVINPEGLVPEADVERLAEFGKQIRRRFSSCIAEVSGVGRQVSAPIRRPAKISRIVIQEQIEHGERVRGYEVEGLVGADRWRTLCRGKSIGHKRIEVFEPVEVAGVKVTIHKATATPIVRSLKVYAASG